MGIINKDFFLQDAKEVAINLLGKKIVRKIGDNIVSGIISETEAYLKKDDSASHARFGKTKRNAPMFEEGGIVYVYLIYGVYHMLNFVTQKKDEPSAVLIRKIVPLENIELMQKFRGNSNIKNLSDGPGKLCKALNINMSLNRHKLFTKEKIWIEDMKDNSILKKVQKGTRIGIDYADKKDKNALLRFWI